VVLTTAAVLASLACQLPGQNVMLASVIIAFIAGAVQTLGALTAIPFGPYVYTEHIGQQLFYPCLGRCLWCGLQSCLPPVVSRGQCCVLAQDAGLRLLADRHHRAARVMLDLGLEPFATNVKHYWFWSPTKLKFDWYSTPWVNFFGWAVTALLILAFATPPSSIRNRVHNRRLSIPRWSFGCC